MKYELTCGDCEQGVKSNEWPQLSQIPHLESCPSHRERLNPETPKVYSGTLPDYLLSLKSTKYPNE